MSPDPSTFGPLIGHRIVQRIAAWAAWVTCASLVACTVEDDINHGEGHGSAYSGGTPGAPCHDGDVPEAGYCIDYGPNGHDTCVETDECRPGYVCRAFDVSACTCDPRPGAWEQCAPSCSTDDDCNRSRNGSVSDWGHVCDEKRGICRHPTSCLTDADCPESLLCTDGTWLHWYVGGDEQLHEMEGPRRCAQPGARPDGSECWFGTECASGLCFEAAERRLCATPCSRNDECADGVCLQTDWGAPSCRPLVESTCDGPGKPDELCHRGQWIRSCADGGDCAAGDCRFPDAPPGSLDYGGLGFGVGHCLEEKVCNDDEVRSAWRDAWAAPTCLTTTSCWDDTDCTSPRVCLALDALGSTRRCGIEIEEAPSG